MTAPKLDRWLKASIAAAAMHRADAARMAIGAESTVILRQAATRRIVARWGAPEIQADMAVLAKYGHAHRITAANLSVWDPLARYGYENRFGCTLDIALMMPGGSMHVRCSPTGAPMPDEPFNCFESNVGPDDPDHDALATLIRIKRSQATIGYEEREAVTALLKQTASLRRVIAAFPWVAELPEIAARLPDR